MFCSTANNFLMTLAQENGGRFHYCQNDFDAELFIHTLLEEGFHDHEVLLNKSAVDSYIDGRPGGRAVGRSGGRAASRVGERAHRQ